MADILFHMNLHYSARDLSEIEVRERVEQALNIACSNLEDFRDTEYVGYKIRETTDLS